MADKLRTVGGLRTEEGFVGRKAEFVVPTRAAYRGYAVFKCPPDGIGIMGSIPASACEWLGERGCI